LQKFDHNIGFLRKTPIFSAESRQKMDKIAIITSTPERSPFTLVQFQKVALHKSGKNGVTGNDKQIADFMLFHICRYVCTYIGKKVHSNKKCFLLFCKRTNDSILGVLNDENVCFLIFRVTRLGELLTGQSFELVSFVKITKVGLIWGTFYVEKVLY
jgi:hypothetical protein